MATKPLQSVTFPDLPNQYTVPVVDDTLSKAGAAADAKKTGDELTDLKADISDSNTFHRNQIVYGENRYYHDESRLITDKYIVPSEERFDPYNGWSISDFIPVDPETVYVMAYHSGGRYIVSTNNYYALYDTNFRYIRSATIAERQTNTIITTAETAYVRNSTITERFSRSTIFIEKSVFDLGVEHFIPFSIKFINDNTAEEISELQSDFSELQSDFSELQSDFSEKKDVTLTVETQKRYSVVNGQLQIATGVNYNTIKSAIINVTVGDRYYYTGRVYNYTNQYSLIAVDSNDVPIEYELAYTSDTQVVDYLFVIPTNATKLIVQSYVSNPIVQKLEVVNFQEIKESLDSKIDISDSVPQYDNVMRSIQRIGGFGGTPHHSVIGYVNAYKAGFRILLCDLRFTSDNVPVLFHDEYLNQHYSDVYDSNGQLVGTEPPINIADNTYETLNAYDYGLYKGEAYRGYPLMTLYDMLSLAKRLGVEVYIEVKAMTEAQAKIASDAVCAYGMSEKTSWSGTKTQMQYVIANIDTARVSTMPSSITTSVIADLVSLKTGKNKVFVFAWDTTVLTSETISSLIENDIAFELGTLNTEADILSYFEKGVAYYYCTGIESDYYIAGKTILENALS